MPARDLFISPGHSMLVNGTLVLGWSLVNGVTITQNLDCGDVHYFHIDLEHHDCVIAEGAWSESFADSSVLRQRFSNAAEFALLYPNHPPADEISLCAPRPEEGPKLDAALRGVVARAQSAVRPGQLRGAIDRVTAPWSVYGWAQDIAYPELPVLLDVLVNNRVIATTLACDFRQDLKQAGIGQGRSAFFLTSPIRLHSGILGSLRIRRAADGTEIQMMPEATANVA